MKRALRTSVATGVAVSAGVVLAVSCSQAAGTPGWRLAAVYPQAQGIWSVSASGAANAWAVGQTSGLPCALCLFTSHWNGRKWQPIAEPNGLKDGVNPVVGGASVAAIAGGRAWIFVARVNAELGTSEVDAVEWTGTSWSAVHDFGSLHPGALSASGPGDVWGFGSSNGTPWAVHYNGESWSRVAIPVSVSDASGSAAAGEWVTGTVAGQPKRVEVLHWSKGAWRNAVLPQISVPKGDQMLPGLIATATTADVWVSIGVGPATGHGPVTTVLLHWNGTAWSKVAFPKGGSIYGLASDGHEGSWVASYTLSKPGVILAGLVMYHYSSGHWTHVPGPVKSGFVTNLTGGNMELIPGTRSVLASATLFSSRPAGIEGAILKYGP